MTNFYCKKLVFSFNATTQDIPPKCSIHEQKSDFHFLDELGKPHVRGCSTQAVPGEKTWPLCGSWWTFTAESSYPPCYYVLHVFVPQCNPGLSTYGATRNCAACMTTWCLNLCSIIGCPPCWINHLLNDDGLTEVCINEDGLCSCYSTHGLQVPVMPMVPLHVIVWYKRFTSLCQSNYPNHLHFTLHLHNGEGHCRSTVIVTALFIGDCLL